MTLDAAAIEKRRGSIGSSDIAKLWNGRAMDLYFDKALGIDQVFDDATLQRFALGNALEPTVLDWAERRDGVEIHRNCYTTAGANRPLHSNADGMADGARGYEAKTTGIDGPPDPAYGQPGTDQIPTRNILQCQVHMICFELEEWHVPVLIGGHGCEMYVVHRRERLCAKILADVQRFWYEHVVPRVPPGPEWNVQLGGSLATLKRQPRELGKILSAQDFGKDGRKLYEQWRHWADQAREAGKIADGFQAEMYARLGDAQGAALPKPTKAQQPPEFIYVNQSEIAEHTVKGSTRRQLTGKRELPQLEK